MHPLLKRSLLFVGAIIVVLALLVWGIGMETIKARQVDLVYLGQQHMILVFSSMFFALLVGIPAGILLSRPAARGIAEYVMQIFNVGNTLPPLAVLALALGIAVAAAEFFGASMALGAFLAGMVVGQSEFSARAAAEALPLRDAFSVLFFLAVGMLFEPKILLEQPLHVLAVVGIIIVGKSLAAMAIVLAFRYPLTSALTVSASLARTACSRSMPSSLHSSNR